jgi:hypothetical protein
MVFSVGRVAHLLARVLSVRVVYLSLRDSFQLAASAGGTHCREQIAVH